MAYKKRSNPSPKICRLQLRLTKETRDRIEQLAEIEECSMAQLITMIIRQEWQRAIQSKKIAK